MALGGDLRGENDPPVAVGPVDAGAGAMVIAGRLCLEEARSKLGFTLGTVTVRVVQLGTVLWYRTMGTARTYLIMHISEEVGDPEVIKI